MIQSDQYIFLQEIDYYNILKLDKYSILDYQVEELLTGLYHVHTCQIEGEVVELGCNVGETSKAIQKLLTSFKINKKLYVYDSFEGLPEPTRCDFINGSPRVAKGILKTSEEIFINNFNTNKIELPFRIVRSWFKDIQEEDIPSRISFVFLDGDLYNSTLEGLEVVWPRMVTGGRVYIHDVGHPKLPGVSKAIEDFSDSYKLFFQETCYGLGYFTK